MYTTDWVNYKQIPALAKLERETPDPRTKKWLRAVLKNRYFVGLVCCFDGQVVAYMLYRMHKSSFEILRLVVTENHRRKRVASMMLSKLINKLTPFRRGRLVCLVRDSNLPIQLVLRGLGIEAKKVHRSYYREQDAEGNILVDEDAYEFEFVHPQCRLSENGVEFIKENVQ